MTASLEAAVAEMAAETAWDPESGAFTLQGAPPCRPGDPPEVALRDQIYARYFTRWSPPPEALQRPFFGRVDGVPEFVAWLEAAAEGCDCWEPGYRVVKAGDGWAYVAGVQLTLFVDDVRSLHPPGAREGDEVSVRVPCARPNLSPGFFYFVGRSGPVDSSQPHAKLYLNLAPELTAPLLQALLRDREVERLVFEGKAVNDPDAYCRADTAVLYVAPGDLSELLRFLGDFHARHAGGFRDGAPLMTRELMRGVGLAESPIAPPGAPLPSFGQHRCGLLARAVALCLREARPASAWMDVVRAVFDAEGLSADRPWRGTLDL